MTSTDIPVQVQVSNFTLSPADVGLADKDGEGHVHVMLDGMNMGVLFNFYTSPTFTLPGQGLCWSCAAGATESELARLRRVNQMLPADVPDDLLAVAMDLCGDCDLQGQFQLGLDLMLEGLEVS